jgi:hypothetical protein
MEATQAWRKIAVSGNRLSMWLIGSNFKGRLDAP